MITLQQAIDIINKEFKGKATDDLGLCRYLTQDGRKCAVGVFLPDGHPAQKVLNLSYAAVYSQYPEIEELMPLNANGMDTLQSYHDWGLNDNDPVERQKQRLIMKLKELSKLERYTSDLRVAFPPIDRE